MQQPMAPGVDQLSAPSFYLTSRQPLRPGALLLATVAAMGALASVLYALGHNGRVALATGSPGANKSASPTAGAPKAGEDDDDPSQVDTIVLGDPGDAPVPARKGDHVSAVHPTLLIHLPRFGEQVGLIPDTPAGRLLYGWLAAFNQASYPGLGNALPNVALGPAAAAQIELRRQTGGFSLLSAREVEPGVLVFRLRDQTPAANEALGTLRLQANSSPAAIESFSLRGVAGARRGAGAEAAPNLPAAAAR